MDYKTKYIKYKTKYINLIKQKAGVQSETLHNNWSNIPKVIDIVDDYSNKVLDYDLDYEGLKADRAVVLAAVTQKGYALRYASEALKGDKQVVLTAVTQKGMALEYADNKLKNDKDVVLAAVSQYGMALEYADDILKNDKDIVLTAVTQKGMALEYAHFKLKNDKDVVLAAVSQDGMALKYADDILKNDKDVVLAAVNKDLKSIYYASEILKKRYKSNKKVPLVITHKSENIFDINNKSKKKHIQYWLRIKDLEKYIKNLCPPTVNYSLDDYGIYKGNKVLYETICKSRVSINFFIPNVNNDEAFNKFTSHIKNEILLLDLKVGDRIDVMINFLPG